MTDTSMDPRYHRRGCPQHVHPTQRNPTAIAICTCGGVMPFGYWHPVECVFRGAHDVCRDEDGSIVGWPDDPDRLRE